MIEAAEIAITVFFALPKVQMVIDLKGQQIAMYLSTVTAKVQYADPVRAMLPSP